MIKLTKYLTMGGLLFLFSTSVSTVNALGNQEIKGLPIVKSYSDNNLYTADKLKVNPTVKLSETINTFDIEAVNDTMVLKMTGKDATVIQGTVIAEEDLFDLFNINVLNNDEEFTTEYMESLGDLTKKVDTSKPGTITHIYYDQNGDKIGEFTLTIEALNPIPDAKQLTVITQEVNANGEVLKVLGTQKAPLIDTEGNPIKAGATLDLSLNDILKGFDYVTPKYPLIESDGKKIVKLTYTDKEETIYLNFIAKKDGEDKPIEDKKETTVSFTVKDTENKVLFSSKSKLMKEGDISTLEINPENFKGYTVKSISEGTMKGNILEVVHGKENKDVIVILEKKKDTKVTYELIDQTTNKVLEKQEKSAPQGTKGIFDISLYLSEGYSFVSTSDGKLENGKIEITHTDKDKLIKVIVKQTKDITDKEDNDGDNTDNNTDNVTDNSTDKDNSNGNTDNSSENDSNEDINNSNNNIDKGSDNKDNNKDNQKNNTTIRKDKYGNVIPETGTELVNKSATILVGLSTFTLTIGTFLKKYFV